MNFGIGHLTLPELLKPAVQASKSLASGEGSWRCACKKQSLGRPLTSRCYEMAPELTGHGLPLIKCEAYNRVYEQHYGSS